ncbi:hypothetical protein HVX13_07280 [Citrobacter freundii]|nr:hypothetical protein [Citrobacter freundii]MBA8334313.1 hypothetical protein [Citrobacter freundii]QLM85666.1 hypothetical protein HVX13_07280 [Citrobacter freundii]QMM21624.1 hypothetical protein HVX18_07275 [Citrobacter freundii]
MARHKFTNRKARIEKKFSKSAMILLIQLRPRSINRKDFSLEYGDFKGRNGTVYHDEWHLWDSPDYWTGECDSYDAFFVLHDNLIAQTHDFEGEMDARNEVGWGAEIDITPFCSPWRIGNVTRSQIIRHCRQLVSAGINWDA